MRFLFILSFLLLAGLTSRANEGGCNFTVEITPSGPTTICGGDSVTLTATAGATYDWSNGATTQSIVVYFPGNYSVTVTDGQGCDDSDNQFIAVLPSPIAAIIPSQEPPYCEGDTVQLFTTPAPFGGYEWSTGETTLSITVTTSNLYTVTVTNSLGCSDSSSLPMLFIPTVPVFTFENGPTTFCEGESVNIRSSVFFGGQHEWFPNGETTQSIDATESGDYYVVVTWPTGCISISETVEVNAVPVPVAYAGKDTSLCAGDSVELTASGGTALAWSTGETDPTITVGQGTYSVSANNPGCNIISHDTVVVSNSPPPQANFGYDNLVYGDEVAFTDLSVGNVYSWYWDFGDGDFAETIDATHEYDEEGEYTITLVVANQYGCADTIEKTIEIAQVLTIPTVFTPNGDGINDLFLIENKVDGRMNIEVYDRWGNKVFNKEAREIRWDGRTNSGSELSAGTYSYVLRLDVFANQEPTVQAGFLTLIK